MRNPTVDAYIAKAAPFAQPILAEIQRYKDDLFRDLTDGLDKETIETVTQALLHMKGQLTEEAPAKAAAAGE